MPYSVTVERKVGAGGGVFVVVERERRYVELVEWRTTFIPTTSPLPYTPTFEPSHIGSPFRVRRRDMGWEEVGDTAGFTHWEGGVSDWSCWVEEWVRGERRRWKFEYILWRR